MPVLHGHRVVRERALSLEQKSRAETQIADVECQLLRAVPALVVEEEDRHRLGRSRRGETVRHLEPRPPAPHVPRAPVQVREPEPSPAAAVRDLREIYLEGP